MLPAVAMRIERDGADCPPKMRCRAPFRAEPRRGSVWNHHFETDHLGGGNLPEHRAPIANRPGIAVDPPADLVCHSSPETLDGTCP